MTKARVAAGTIVGPHHRKNNEENQDALFYQQEDDFTVIAAADGAGSLKNSKFGAELVSYISVEETLNSLLNEESTIEQALRNGVERAKDDLMAQNNWETMGCTLSLAVHSPDGWGVALVGDAFAVVSKSVTEHELIHREPDSEYANITKLITSKNYDPLYVFGDEKICAVSVASDGLTNLSVNISEHTASPNFWTPLIRRASENEMNVEAFLEYLNKNEKLYDDTTLVIASSIIQE